MSFENKTVIITRATSCIGMATAISFASKKAAVVLVGNNEFELARIYKACNRKRNKNLMILADVGVAHERRKIIDKTIETFGKIHILINNAAISESANITDENVMEVHDRIMNTNLRASVHLTYLAVPYLHKTKGNIINISSIAASMTIRPGLSSYCISKAAMNHFTRCIAAELVSKKIRVNTVSPGPVRTELTESQDLSTDFLSSETPLGRISHPSEVAEVVLFLASIKSAGTTGSEFIVDNGIKVKH